MINHMTISDAEMRPSLFTTMHEDRKRIFVDMLKWDIAHDGRQERDSYDTELAQYLILNDPETDEHLGSVRLLPTTSGHILGDVFPFLCESEVPIGPDIWEITRLIVSPRVKRQDRLAIRNMLGRAMIEYGLLMDIQQYTCVCEMGFLSQLLASGWRCEPLGLPQLIDASMIGALKIQCDTSSLARTRDGWRCDSPALRISDKIPLAA